VTDDRRSWSACGAACAFSYLLLGGLFSLRLGFFHTRWFNPDEFVHMHAAWCVAEGGVPYRDFYVHHTPWLWYLLAPLVAGAANDPSSAVHALVLGRATSLVLSGATLCVVVWLGWIWSGPLGGPVAALILAGLRIFLLKTVEIRPDVPALLLWIGCLVGLAHALGGAGQRGGRRGAFLAAGLSLGGALMFNQKIAFVLPGVGLVGLAWIVCASPRTAAAARVVSATWFVVGLCAPFAATWAYLAAHAAGSTFLHHTMLLASQWKAAEPPEPWLRQLATEEWPVLLLTAGGVGTWLWGCVRARRCDWLGLVLLASAISLLLGLLVVATAFAQYYLPLLPLLALFAARCLSAINAALPARVRWVVLCPVLALLQITPLTFVRDHWDWQNDQQLKQLAYVMANAAPSEPVLDGFRGLGVFRPHAWYYYWLAADLRGMLPRETVDAFIDDLESGRVKPKVVVADVQLVRLSPRLAPFVRSHYTYGADDIWLRNPG